MNERIKASGGGDSMCNIINFYCIMSLVISTQNSLQDALAQNQNLSEGNKKAFNKSFNG